jgi:glycosyltransferase involved in cell wall biosynthesis
MKIAIIGTRGVPARYGGFETAVEEIGAGLAARGHEVVVYCRGPGDDSHYRGMRRVVLPSIHRRTLETITHSGLSTLHALRRRPDVAVLLNTANAPYVALLRAAGIPTVLHLDGHDARRAKWRGIGSRYYSLAGYCGRRLANRVVVDSQAVRLEVGLADDPKAAFIAYGAKQTSASPQEIDERLSALGLRRDTYHLVVARFEPENHVLEIIEGYSLSAARLPLVAVGFEGYPGRYTDQIVQAAARDLRVSLLGRVWDQDVLDAMYAGAASYVHGHSVGGTNPSLLRAMIHGAPIIAYDCAYNRETTGGAALWFKSPAQIAAGIEHVEAHPQGQDERVARARERASRDYVWADVVESYDSLLSDVSRA